MLCVCVCVCVCVSVLLLSSLPEMTTQPMILWKTTPTCLPPSKSHQWSRTRTSLVPGWTPPLPQPPLVSAAAVALTPPSCWRSPGVIWSPPMVLPPLSPIACLADPSPSLRPHWPHPLENKTAQSEARERERECVCERQREGGGGGEEGKG